MVPGDKPVESILFVYGLWDVELRHEVTDRETISTIVDRLNRACRCSELRMPFKGLVGRGRIVLNRGSDEVVLRIGPNSHVLVRDDRYYDLGDRVESLFALAGWAPLRPLPPGSRPIVRNGACHHLETYALGGQGVMAAGVISSGSGRFAASERGDAIAALQRSPLLLRPS